MFPNSCSCISRHFQGLLLALLGTLILSIDTILIRKLGNVDNFVVIFYKNFLFAMPLALYVIVSSGLQGTVEKFRAIGPVGVLAGLVWGASNFLITYGFQITDVASVLVIVSCNPVFSAVFSYLILRVKVPWYTILASFVCLGCIVVIFSSQLTSSEGTNIGGLLAALGCAVGNGLYFVLLKYIDNQSQRPSGTLDTMPCNIIAGLFAAIVALILDPNPIIPDTMSGVYLFLDGVVVVGISFTLLNICTSMISPTEVSLMILVETGVGPVLVFLAGYEAPPEMAIYGGCALAVALILHSYVALKYVAMKTLDTESGKNDISNDDEDKEIKAENSKISLDDYSSNIVDLENSDRNNGANQFVDIADIQVPAEGILGQESKELDESLDLEMRTCQ